MPENAPKLDPSASGPVAGTFEEIMNANQQALMAIASRMLLNLEDARDATQEAFIRFWQHGTWRDASRPAFPLLARTLVNLCIDRLRRRKLLRLFLLDGVNEALLVAPGGSALQHLENLELRQALTRAIEELKPRQKAVVILRDVEGYSVAETAEILDCSPGSVTTNLHLARRNLQKKLHALMKERVIP